MDFKTYLELFDDILNGSAQASPYDQQSYLDYTELNRSRMKRWLKNGNLLPEAIEAVQKIGVEQHWILITEPWCGDASHSVPFIVRLAEINPLITLEIQLRDSGSEIDNYLTNGGRAIPYLIIRNTHGEDLAVWGPRPKACQEFYYEMRNSDMPAGEQKIALQNWYNKDRGETIQLELIEKMEN
ncbi:MAG: hypothetical protein K0R65_1686 [Crocinitomicaceae bacterium]|jgi:hypothetical protein|nr:hypothetical protein [Crocinitomicaceae bacterium]